MKKAFWNFYSITFYSILKNSEFAFFFLSEISYFILQAQCPEGTYTDVEGTPDLASCKPCSAGYYCPIASSVETLCDRGYYCVANSSKPEPCPIGRYGNVSGTYHIVLDLTSVTERS